MSPVNFSEMLNPQWEAGTGRKRKIPYTGVMAGSAVNAPEEQRLSKLTALENERIDTIASQFDKEQRLRQEALKASESQAKTGNLIQMGGLGLQGTYLATRPEITGLVKGAATKIFGGGVLPNTALDAGSLGTGMAAGTESLEAAGTVGYGAEAAGTLAPGAAAVGTEGLGAAGTVGYGAEAAGTAYGAETAGAGVMGAAGSYIPVVGGGLIGGALGASGGRWLGEELGVGGERERSIGGGIVGGAAAGAAIGSVIPGIGTAVGAVVGGVVGGAKEFLDCIIITACTNPKSDEVNLAREYRDKFMNKAMLRGYYHLAERVVPLMKLIPQYNHYIRENLVRYLIDYGNYVMGRTNKCHLKARIITLDFLAYCEKIGSQFTVYRRMNGEEV